LEGHLLVSQGMGDPNRAAPRNDEGRKGGREGGREQEREILLAGGREGRRGGGGEGGRGNKRIK